MERALVALYSFIFFSLTHICELVFFVFSTSTLEHDFPRAILNKYTHERVCKKVIQIYSGGSLDIGTILGAESIRVTSWRFFPY